MIPANGIEEYLAEPCPDCGRPMDAHTLREYFEHTPRQVVDLPYAPVDGDPIDAALGDRPLTDHVNARAGLIGTGPITLPIVLLDFLAGVPGEAPLPRASVGFIGTPGGMRQAGSLIRAACYDAAAQAEGGTRSERRQRKGRRHG